MYAEEYASMGKSNCVKINNATVTRYHNQPLGKGLLTYLYPEGCGDLIILTIKPVIWYCRYQDSKNVRFVICTAR